MNTDKIDSFFQLFKGLRQLEPQRVSPSRPFFKSDFEQVQAGFATLGGLENVGSADTLQPIARGQDELERKDAGPFDGVINRGDNCHLILAQTDVVAENSFDLRLDRCDSSLEFELGLEEAEGIERSLDG